MRPTLCLLIACSTFGTAVAGEPPIVASTRVDPASGAVDVELIALNGDAAPRRIPVAPTLEAALEAPNGTHAPVRLERAADQPEAAILPPSGFARLSYRFFLPTGTGPGPLTLRLPGAQTVVITVPEAEQAGPVQAAAATAARPVTTDKSPSAPPAPRADNGLLTNLSTYEPIYAVYGPGTNSDARLQVSFKYQLFGTAGQRDSWLDGIMLGYTQQMFWDTGRASSPFRDVAYMPELYYALPELTSAGRWGIGGRFGISHQSNGRSGAASRSFNLVYVEPQAETRIGKYDFAIGPRLWAYAGRRSDNPDIAHYRGHAGLFARIGTPDGIQLNASGRLNPSSGKGAADALVSYPLTSLFETGPRLYLFGQGFVGYGEDLLDYNRRQTRLRAGIGITR